MNTQKWVNLFLLVASFVAFLFLTKMIELGWSAVGLPFVADWPVEPYIVLSFVMAVVLGLLFRRSEKSNAFLNEATSELSKVVFPGRKETVVSTGVVSVLVSIAAVILFVFDNIWGVVTKQLLSL